MLQANAVYFERIFDNNYLEGIYRHYNPLRTDVPFAEMVHTFEGIFLEKNRYTYLNLKVQVFFVKWQQMIIMILLGSLMLIIVEKQML